MKKIIIPQEHYDKFKFFLELPQELKTQIYVFFNSLSIGVSPNILFEVASEKITELPKERIGDIVSIFLNLNKAKDNLEVDTDTFIDILSEALNNTGDEGLKGTKETSDMFRELLSTGKNITVTSKILEIMSESQKIFLDAGISQDIKNAFDNNDNYLGSAIVHNLKIKFKENDKISESYFSLDNIDIDKLISLLRKSQERATKLREQSGLISIIDIKQ